MYPNRCMLFVLLGLTCAICSADALVMPGNRMQPARWGSRPSTTLKRTERVYAQNPHTVLRGGQVGVSSATFLEQLNSKVVLRRLALLLHTFVDPVISGGLLSGGLHAITGPDHLAALIAPSVGKSGFNGLRIGALWGIGHGISALLLGLTAYYLKGQFTGRFAIMEKMATYAESAVGFSILFIGAMGIKESREAEHEEASNSVNFVNFSSASVGTTSFVGDSTATIAKPAAAASSVAKPKTYRAILANGMLHGFSWDGAPSLAPAIAMSSWRGALAFLLAYSLGTIIAMSIAAGAVGELSMRVGQATGDPDLPKKLSLVSSVAAVAIGTYMIAKSFILR